MRRSVATRKSRGQVLPLLALSLAAIVGFSGLSVDVCYWEYCGHVQQNATDAAAIGGAQQLAYANCPNSAVAQQGATLDAAANGFTSSGNETITVENPPSSGPYQGDDCAVSVKITTKGVPSFFSRLFGSANDTTETTQAVAIVTYDNPTCMYLLSQTATLNLNGDVILAPKCAIYANSSTVETFGTIMDVRAFGYAHALQENLLSLFLGAGPKKMLPIADPCPEITSCAYLAGNPPAATGCQSFVNTSILPVTVNPGCYSDFENNIGIVSMNPGLYVFTGPVNNTGILTGDGVTMYVTPSGGPVGLNGSVVLIAPPTSGNYAGVLFYQDPSNSNPVAFNASVQLSLAGLVYAPNSLGEILGQANVTFGKYTVFVLGTEQLLAGVQLSLPGPSNGQSLVKRAILAQ